MARAGGANIASSMERDLPKPCPEWILEKQPQVIMADLVGRTFTGYNVDMPVTMENMRKLAEEIKADKVLADTEPAKNDRVLIIPQDCKQGPAYVIGMECIPGRYASAFRRGMAETSPPPFNKRTFVYKS